MNKKQISYPVKVWEPHFKDLVYVCDLALSVYDTTHHLYCSNIAHEVAKEFSLQYPGLKVILHDGQIMSIKGEYELIDEFKDNQFKIIFGKK
jgi:hypothetical protein